MQQSMGVSTSRTGLSEQEQRDEEFLGVSLVMQPLPKQGASRSWSPDPIQVPTSQINSVTPTQPRNPFNDHYSDPIFHVSPKSFSFWSRTHSLLVEITRILSSFSKSDSHELPWKILALEFISQVEAESSHSLSSPNLKLYTPCSLLLLQNHFFLRFTLFFQDIYFCPIDYAKAIDCVDHNKLWKILQETGIQTTLPPPEKSVCISGNNS